MFTRRKNRSSGKKQRERLGIETLEPRQLLAADVQMGPVPEASFELIDAPVAAPRTETAEGANRSAASSSQTRFTNPANPIDVDGSGYISDMDAHLIVSELNNRGSRQLTPSDSPSTTQLYLDTNQDGYLSPVDVLLVVNELAQHNELPDPVGESPLPHTNVSPATPLTNPRNPLDVDDSGDISPTDVRRVLETLDNQGAR